MRTDTPISIDAMPRHRRRLSPRFIVIVAGSVAAASGAAGQHSDADASAAEPGSTTVSPVDPARCFSVPSLMDMNVLSDRHLYLKTRDGHEYLMTTQMCDSLEQSYLRSRPLFLVPYGRTVCQNDGSYLLYDAGGLQRPCAILTIRPVEDRAEARAAARNELPPIEVREVTPEEPAP